jgi:hypothetical protein
VCAEEGEPKGKNILEKLKLLNKHNFLTTIKTEIPSALIDRRKLINLIFYKT